MTAEQSGPGDKPSFERDIKKLFRPMDREAMLPAFDLWSYEDVSLHASPILEHLQAGSMPCDGAWPAAQVAVFAKWVVVGMPK
jgi:hypothetical protein